MSLNLSTTSPLTANSTDHIINANFDFRSNPGLVFVLISCTCTGLWMLFLTFYLSRITGYILTKIIRRFYMKDGYLSIGSFSMSLLSGKFMFRNIRYITKDLSIIVVDGQAILKWWLTYDAANINYYKKLSKDQDICDATQSRLTFHLNGLEIHIFNRSDLYNSIQNILKCERYGDARKSITSLDVLKNNVKKRENSQESKINKWRELFPLIRMNIRSGKLALGNRLLETTLWVHFNKGSAAYSMPDALSTLDYYTHFFQCKCDDLRVLLSKSPDYVGVASEPPRFMGQGFVVLQSGQAKILYYQDEPGLVPDEAVPDSDPEWGLNVVFTKSANITYGPWVDKQRDALQKFFFPNSFQELAVTKPLESMQQRLHTGFDVKVDFVDSTTLDLLFSKNEETSAIHICCSNPSSLHYYQPWVVNEYGYTSNLIAVLQKIDVTTSLQFRKFLECDQIEVAINMMVPRMWNHFQHWSCELCLAKTTCHFVYDHENFFNDLFTDWSSSEPPDIAKFVPFDWAFNFNLRDFEIILMVNQHNWVECANEDENNELAICGESLDINFTLPNTSFLPEVIGTNFFFRAETIMLRMFVPESNTLRRSIISLARNSDKYIPKKIPKSRSFHSAADFLDVEENFDEIDNGVSLEDQLSQGWRRRTRNTAWIDVWSTPVFLLNIDYKYHPTPIENDTIKNINLKCGLNTRCDKDPEELVHDVLTVTLEAGPSAVRIFGYFWNQFFNGFKDNYFGADQKLIEFNANKECGFFNPSKKSNINQLDTGYFRPLEVNVTVVLLDIHAELTMHTLNNTESPQAFTDRITFEIHKTYSETKMQLIISPVALIIPDSLQRHVDNAHLSKGFLRLSGFQFRGHAMFSDRGIPVGSETIEYSWLTEIQCGNLIGKVTPFQLSSLTLWAETFALHFIDEENQFRSQNNTPDSQTADTNVSFNQFGSTEDLKYKMIRFSIESVNVYLTEAECACNILVSPVRLAFCNASTECCCQGGSLFINEVALRLYVQQVNCEYPSPDKIIKSSSNNWVEVGVIGLGPITADISELCGNKNQSKDQYHYLSFYDGRSKRLWFLWESNELKSKLSVDRMKTKKCGCVGGCDFFGKNVNGVRFFTTQVLDATVKSSNHYGSRSLWGGQSTTGEKVKEYLRKLSGFIPNSNLNSNKSVDEKTKRSSEIFADQEGTAESNVICPNKVIKGSKMDIKRSTSVLVSRHSLVKRFDSMEGSFYSCASENNLFEKIRSMKDLTLPSSQSSDTSKASSSSSYASAVSSVQDLSINLDEVDYPSFLVKPFCQPALLAAYASYLQPLTCINWRQKIPSDLQKNFSLLNNLKVICPPGRHYSSPNIPYFKPNIQGKLPFIIVQNSLSKEDASKDASSKISENTKDAQKRYLTLKLHQQIICILSPLVSKVVERYISAFESITSFCHPCHLLDHFHLGCISRSKEKFLEHCILNTFSQNKNATLEAQINKMAPCKHMTINVELPHFNVLFFQVSTESYTPSDTNSVNGQCGSEYSFDIDTKNSDYTLLALCVSNIKVALHQQLENSSFNNTVVNFFQKFNVTKSASKHEIMYKLEKLIKPSSSALETSIGTAQLQLLHLKGNVDKVPHVTKISQVKSAVNFSVKLGGSLYTDPNNDVIEEDNLGNIICEAGVSEITIKVVLQTQITIAKELSNSETTPATVIDSELPLPVNRQFGDINNRNSLCANSRTSLSSMSDWQKVRKGYVALDIDSGENTTEPTVTFGRSNIGIGQQVSFKQQSLLHNDVKKINANDSCKIIGDANVKHFWINLATPTHLRTIQKVTDQDINLVTVLIPAISSWVPCIVDLLRTLHVVRNSFKFLNYSTLACLMSQSLPENGKLLKKHFTVSAASEESSFLQGDYSSQLICVLRRQTTGQRLITLLQALKNPNLCPGLADLEAGLQALSRQWKCVFIGAEGFENIFAVKNACIKKPVVGRGMLTQKDLRLLLKDKKIRTSSVTSYPQVDQTNPIQNIEDEPLLDSDSDTEPESQEKAIGKEQSLYDWMSRSPTSMASLNKKSNGSENVKQNGLLQETTKRTIELEMLQSQMVSVPTSGVQLAEATEVFSALLGVVGLINPKDVLLVWSHSKFTCQVNKASINLVESDQTKKVEDSMATFEVCNTNFCTSSDLQKNNESSQRNITFTISMNDLKQHVNFPLVRLILQISETFNVVLEQKKFAKKFIQQPNKVLIFTELSAEQQHQPHTLKSWRNMYNVINLYIPKQSSPDTGQNVKIDGIGPDGNSIIAHEEKVAASSQKQAVDRFSISGTFCLHNALLTASISGLEFSLDMQQLNLSFYCMKGNTSTREAFCALNRIYESRLSDAVHSEEIITLTAHMEETKICLLDSFFKKSPSNLSKLSRVLMTCKIYKTNGIYNELKCNSIKSKLKTLLTIGPIAVEIPQHPGTLRFVSTRFTKKLHKYFSEFEDYRMSIREARQSSSDHNELNNMKESWASLSTLSLFRISTSSILVSATLLPSLRAEYKIEQVSGFGNFNGKFKFALNLQGHSLSFKTKNQIVPLPASAHICLPAINVDGHYVQISKQVSSEPPLYSNGHGYLFVSINIGNLEQNLTTDLMNHLIFLQKGFIKEVNEVVQDVEENETIPLWFSSYEEEISPSNPLIYSIQLKISLIRITASIPSGTAVVLKTGIISVEFSNQSPSASVLNSPQDNFLKYGTVQFLFDLSLGQFTKNINTGQQDFLVFASFITSLYVANTFDNQSVENKRKETITVTLDHPRILIKLPAVDKGVLVYLHFKNGYDQWRIQRNIISSDFPNVVEHLFAKPSQENASQSMDLVLQITITNMGVCLPLQDFDVQQGAAFLSGIIENEHGHGQALVVTVQEMSISCCSSGSFVSTGLFRKFRLQFNESFDHMALQWIINEQELMNTYCIPEGSYQLCSKTTSSATSGFPPKWLMTLFWKMCGVDIHIDCNIGKQLRLLTNALTTIMGESDVGDLSSVAEADLEGNEPNEYVIVEEDDVFDGSSLPLNQEVSLDKQLWIQTNLINNLRRENADDDVINHEVKILQEIENALSVEFFKDVKMHFRRKSSRRPLPSHTNDVQKSTPRKGISSSHKSVQGKTPENFKKKSKKYVNQLENSSEMRKVKFDHTANNPSPVQANTAKNDIGSKLSQVPFFDSIYELGELDLDSTSKMPSNASSISMDFELNIVVDIDSGKCTLHLSNPTKDGDTISENSSMVDISHKPPFYKADSFNSKFRQSHSAAAVLSSHLPMLDESVVLLIPGVNARVHYLSSNYKEKEPLFTDGSDADSNGSSRKYANKIGSLNSVLSIQSLPKEMILRPSLLDFIEKALEPIMGELGGSLEDNISAPATASVLSSSGSGLYSFPVNVVVIIRIDPSDIRFSCLPASKVECLLRIPSLDFAITSCPPPCTIPYSNSPKKPNKPIKRHSSSSLLYEDNSVSASFSCTACLSRFSFCIFHPYGKQYPVLSESNFPRVDVKSDSNRPISGRKDSLSLNVEFIKFNLSRKRTKLQSDVNESEKQDFRAAVKVSVICDIGSAAFNCDMRRTHEILDVPKAWYKHDLMRRMFLGKEGTYATSMTREGKIVTSTYVAEDVLPANEMTAINPLINFSGGHRRAKSGSAAFLENLIGSPFPTPRSTTSRSPNQNFVFDSLKPPINETVGPKIPVSTNGSDTCSEWETNVVLTFNVSHVDVSTNTGNVMGQVIWNTNDLHLNAGILVSNIGVNTKTVELSIRQGSFNTHGGVIGGSIEVQEISTLGRFSENINEAVSHKANLTIKSAEIRLDYMGSCIIMTSLSLFKVKLDNEWPFKLTESPRHDSGDVKIFVKCDVDWDELQIIMSRSTASDSTKLVLKLEEFFNQQHQSSVKLLSSLHKFDNSLSHLKMSVVEEPEKDIKKELKYQHWIKLLKKSCCKKLHGDEIPNKKVSIGGKLFIRGNFLSLACFHGSNFRSQSWALFTMKEPCLEFISETRVVEKSCQVYRGLCVQKGIFSLGKKSSTHLFERRQSVESLSDFMATVRRVSRGRRNPPSLGAPVHEWLVFINTVNAHDLPSSIKGKEISEKLTHVKLGSGLRKVSFAPKYRYENDSEVIFGLPQFSLQLITEHDQPISCFNLNSPEVFGNSPHIVDTQLLSSFDDSICVTMDASLYFFLHDLILSYMKEKQSTVAGGSRLSRKQNVEVPEILPDSRSSTIITECKYREFRSKGWKVEPRVRFLSWAGQQIEPVSIDWVLEKLGFMHAALTIPKWVQRGALDPLDKTLAHLMNKLLAQMVKDAD